MPTDDVLALIRRGINDPGSVLPRDTHGDTSDEGISAWEARAVQQLLTEAGLLLPPDEERNRQYGRRLDTGRIIATAGPDPTHYRLNGPWREVSNGE